MHDYRAISIRKVNDRVFLSLFENFSRVFRIAPSDDHQHRTTTASSSFPEETIREITKNGFTREQAIDELKSTSGDAKKALVSLMAKSLAMPKRKR